MILAQQIEHVEIQTHGQPALLNRFLVNDIFVVASTASASNSRIASIVPALCRPFAVSCTVFNIDLAIFLYLDQFTGLDRFY
jgi:hypothetical protein